MLFISKNNISCETSFFNNDAINPRLNTVAITKEACFKIFISVLLIPNHGNY